MLNEVEICGGDWLKRNSEIADQRDCFQEHFRQKNGGTPIEINAAGVHLLYKRTEQAKIEMRGGAESSGIHSRMHVRDIGADGDMNGQRYSIPIRGDQDAVIRKF